MSSDYVGNGHGVCYNYIYSCLNFDVELTHRDLSFERLTKTQVIKYICFMFTCVLKTPDSIHALCKATQRSKISLVWARNIFAAHPEHINTIVIIICVNHADVAINTTWHRFLYARAQTLDLPITHHTRCYGRRAADLKINSKQ